MSEPLSDGLQFPDGPKLELDQLIDQLVERAHDVKRTQGRLRELVAAIEVITGELGIEAVLQHIVEAAVGLVGARYGALGVIGDDGQLERFIHTGFDASTVARIGALPSGRGLLGALITDPRTIRVSTLADDPRSSGFPAHHPPMDSFLGAPIRVRGEVYGNIYLTENERGEFTPEDAELVRALAVTAGTAISNARLYEESRRQQRWLSASAEISARLLADSGEDPLRMVVRRASEVADADQANLLLRSADLDVLVAEAAVGDGAEELIGQRFAVAGTLAGEAIASGEPVLLRRLADSSPPSPPRSPSSLDSPSLDSPRSPHLGPVDAVGPVMVVPLVGASRPVGVLSLARRAGRPPFTAADLATATGFANHASVALELAAARADLQRIALLEDRDRIARDLHDHVIQQLFATGLSLESVAARIGPDEAVAAKIRDLVGDLDRTIRQIRTSIFELRGPLDGGSLGLRDRVLGIANELTAGLGFSPAVAFAGPVDTEVTGDLVDDVAACVREGLTNAAKHAEARSATVEVATHEGHVTARVVDDGVGISALSRRSGLANLRTRAERRGGSFEVAARPGGGTELIWKAPLR